MSTTTMNYAAAVKSESESKSVPVSSNVRAKNKTVTISWLSDKEDELEDGEVLDSDNIVDSRKPNLNWGGSNTEAVYSSEDDGDDDEDDDDDEEEEEEKRVLLNKKKKRAAMLTLGDGHLTRDSRDRRAYDCFELCTLQQARDLASVCTLPYYLLSRKERKKTIARVHSHWKAEHKRRRLAPAKMYAPIPVRVQYSTLFSRMFTVSGYVRKRTDGGSQSGGHRRCFAGNGKPRSPTCIPVG